METFVRVIVLPFPEPPVVRQHEPVRETAAHRIGRPDGEHEHEIAVVQVDAVYVAEVICAIGSEPFFIARLDLGGRGGAGEEKDEQESREPTCDHRLTHFPLTSSAYTASVMGL